jgi:hypothetical protein
MEIRLGEFDQRSGRSGAECPRHSPQVPCGFTAVEIATEDCRTDRRPVGAAAAGEGRCRLLIGATPAALRPSRGFEAGHRYRLKTGISSRSKHPAPTLTEHAWVCVPLCPPVSVQSGQRFFV